MKKNPLSEDMRLTTCRCLLLWPALSTPSEHRASLFHCSNHCLYTPPAKHIPLRENPWLMHNSHHFTDILLPMHLCYLYWRNITHVKRIIVPAFCCLSDVLGEKMGGDKGMQGERFKKTWMKQIQKGEKHREFTWVRRRGFACEG